MTSANKTCPALERGGFGGGSCLATELMRTALTGQGHRDHAMGMDNSQMFTVYCPPTPPTSLDIFYKATLAAESYSHNFTA